MRGWRTQSVRQPRSALVYIYTHNNRFIIVRINILLTCFVLKSTTWIIYLFATLLWSFTNQSFLYTAQSWSETLHININLYYSSERQCPVLLQAANPNIKVKQKIPLLFISQRIIEGNSTPTERLGCKHTNSSFLRNGVTRPDKGWRKRSDV